jgi:Gas vesicle protein
MTGLLSSPAAQREVSLVEILDRALGCGVVITGDVTISLADVDLVRLDLRLLLGSVGTICDERGDEGL